MAKQLLFDEDARKKILKIQLQMTQLLFRINTDDNLSFMD